MEIREAARSVAKELGYPNLKTERLEVVETFVKGRDVFAVLPTGYGLRHLRSRGPPSTQVSTRMCLFLLHSC